MNLSDQLGEQFYDESTSAKQPSPLGPYYTGIVEQLLRITEKYVFR